MNELFYFFTKHIYMRLIYQYNSYYETSDTGLLFGYEYGPLSNIYMGVNFNDIT